MWCNSATRKCLISFNYGHNDRHLAEFYMFDPGKRYTHTEQHSKKVPHHSFNIKDCDAVDNNAHYRVIALCARNDTNSNAQPFASEQHTPLHIVTTIIMIRWCWIPFVYLICKGSSPLFALHSVNCVCVFCIWLDHVYAVVNDSTFFNH